MEEQSDINSIKNNLNNNDDLDIKSDKEKQAVEFIKKIHGDNPGLVNLLISKIGNDDNLKKICKNIKDNIYDIANLYDGYKKNISEIKSDVSHEENLEKYLIKKTMVRLAILSKFSEDKYISYIKEYLRTDQKDKSNNVYKCLKGTEHEVIDWAIDGKPMHEKDK
jgi:hypothetical protein